MCVNCQNCEAVGKLFADLWKRLVFFHQVVNGFSIGTRGSFPYFHKAKREYNFSIVVLPLIFCNLPQTIEREQT